MEREREAFRRSPIQRAIDVSEWCIPGQGLKSLLGKVDRETTNSARKAQKVVEGGKSGAITGCFSFRAEPLPFAASINIGPLPLFSIMHALKSNTSM